MAGRGSIIPFAQPSGSPEQARSLFLEKLLVGGGRAPSNIGEGIYSAANSVAGGLLLRELMAEQDRARHGSELAEQGIKEAGASLNPLPGMSMEQTMALMDQPGGMETYQRLFAESKSPAAVKPPDTRDILRGDQRVFQQFNPATGDYEDIPGGIGPAFAPPTQINVGEQKPVTGPAAITLAQAPGALSELAQVESTLFPGGAFDRAVALKMIDPTGTTDEAALDDVFTSGIMIILRNESGGVISPDEIASKKQVYQPKPTDSASRAQAKMARFKRDLSQTLGVAEIGREPAAATDVAPILPEQPGGISGAINQLIQQGTSAIQGVTGGGAPAAPAQAAPAGTEDYGEGEVVLNPATGERLILQGGQWVPYNG